MKFFPTDKQFPESVFNAASMQLICMSLSFFAMTLDMLFSELSFSSYAVQFMFVMMYLVFPYKIMRGSDFFRFMFVVLEGVSMAIYFTSEMTMPQFSTISTFVQFPLIGYTIYLLFSKESNQWFALAKAK